MNKGDLATVVSIIVTVLSLLCGFFETKEQPIFINNISGQVNITFNVEK